MVSEKVLGNEGKNQEKQDKSANKAMKPIRTSVNCGKDLSLQNDIGVKKFSTTVGNLNYKSEVNIDI